MNNITRFDLYIAGRTIAGEARGESPEGQLAVGWVIRNRWESGKWFGKGTVADVCRQRWQFSAWNPGDPNRAFIEKLTLEHPTLQRAMWAAIGVLRNLVADPTGGATHYYVSGSPKPKWAVGKTPVCKIGRHHFFSGID